MKYYKAQDNLIQQWEDGSERRIVKGEPYPETDYLVKLDLEMLKADKNRTPLFRLMDSGEPEPVTKSRAARAAAPKGVK